MSENNQINNVKTNDVEKKESEKTKFVSFSEKGKNLYFCLELNNPNPNQPPEPNAYKD